MRRTLLALALILSATVAEADVRHVWAVNDGEKVERDAVEPLLRARNSAWDGKVVRISGARNEVVAFQVIVEADGRGIGALSMRLPSLTSPADRITYAPPAADPTAYVGRPIQIFGVHYMNVTSSSHASWVYRRGTPAAPPDPTGWKPVQLVPENARAGRGGFPLAVEANQNQAIWVEVYVDRVRKPGRYRGTIEIQADAARSTLPIELEVYDFVLPDENSMHAMLYYSSDQAELYQGRNLDPAFHRLAHRHRVELVHAYDEQSIQKAWGRFSGTDFTRANGFDGPGDAVGNVVVPRTFYGPGRDFDERSSAWSRSDTWMTFVREKLPRAITFLYAPDEPRAPEYPRIVALAENIHSNPGPGRTLPVFVTSTYVAPLDNAIDIWCSGPKGFTLDRVAAERARGREYWFYNGGRPAGGAITIDAPATDARATIWAAFKHDVRVYFYWHSVHWRHNSQKQGERNQNVWADSITYDNRKQANRSPDDQGYIHGDGVLIYPGEDRLHPEEDRGVAGPIATIQLANFRRGLQDHQYLTMARRMGLNAVVDEVLQAIVPRVFSDAGERVSFPETGDPYEAARVRLAAAITRELQRSQSPAASPSTPNQLTAAERAAGWQLLFDGRSLEGWRGYRREALPEAGWEVKDGTLRTVAKVKGADLVTRQTFRDFELAWEWRVAPGGNNGLKYFVTEARPQSPGHEYQMIDDAGYPGALHANQHTADFYDVLPAAADKPVRPGGEWNASRVVVRGNRVEHWLNGRNVLTYELGSAAVKAGIETSKFKGHPGFGDKVAGPIMLTYHQDECWYRNLKIRELK